MMQFDPHAVPPFPVFTLRLDEAGHATLDGVPVEPAPGDSPTTAGTAAAARKAADLGHEAVRVRAHADDGQRYDLVVQATGEIHDITPRTDIRTPVSIRKKALISAAAATVVLALTGSAFAIGTALTSRDEPPAASTSAPPPGAGQALPVGLPDQFSDTATWKAHIDDRAGAKLLTDGRILTHNTSRQLLILNPDTGQSEWSGANAPQDLTTVHETTWQGRPVLAAASPQRLTLWPLDHGTSNVSPVEVDLSARASVTYAGHSPLIDLGDYTVLAPPQAADEDAQRVTLPPGARPAAITERGIVSVAEKAVWTTDPTTGEHSQQPLDSPSGTVEALIPLSDTRTLVQWSDDDTGTSAHVAIIDLDDGSTRAEATLPRQLDTRSAPLIDADAHTAVVGDLFIDYTDAAALVGLDRFQVTAVDGHTLYGTDNDGPRTGHITADTLDLDTYATYSPDDEPPALVTADAAYITHTQVDETYLYRADREQKEHP